MISKIVEEDGPENDVREMDSLELLLQRHAGYTKDVSTVDPGVDTAWRSLEKELPRAQLVVPTTVEKVLYLTLKVLVSRDDIR